MTMKLISNNKRVPKAPRLSINRSDIIAPCCPPMYMAVFSKILPKKKERAIEHQIVATAQKTKYLINGKYFARINLKPIIKR